MVDKKPTRAANIFDVARLAGVSHQTVSRVLNGLPNVRETTKKRVEEAIAELNYSPSPAARALVTRRTRTIGLVAPPVPEYGPVSIAMHFNLAASAARYSVDTIIAVRREPDFVSRAIEGLLRQRVDAIALVVTDFAALEVVAGLDVAIPIVAAASSPRPVPRVVSIDQYRGARSAVRHLAELGHTRILHLAGPADAPDSAERVRGWRDEMAAQNLPIEEPRVGDWTAASGYRHGLGLEIEPGEAVFASNDLTAMGLISALRERGLRVPRDISVVGFDDIPEAAFLFPPLTTVRQDFTALGQLMMQKLLLALEEGEDDTLDTPISTQLVPRGSTKSRLEPEAVAGPAPRAKKAAATATPRRRAGDAPSRSK